MTDASGFYNFSVPAGAYRVGFVTPDGYVFSPPNQGGDPEDGQRRRPDDRPVGALHSHSRAGGRESGRRRVHAAGADLHAHLHADGARRTSTPEPPAQIGDMVWDDFDGDGVRQPDEQGIGELVVTLYDDAASRSPRPLTISPTGLYTFTVEPGTYSLGFELLEGFVFSPQNQGGNRGWTATPTRPPAAPPTSS